MAKTSEATLKAIKKYNQKSKFINIKYTPNNIDEYERISQYCEQNNLSMQGYIKSLIKADLDAKGFSVDSTATIDSADTPWPGVIIRSASWLCHTVPDGMDINHNLI